MTVNNGELVSRLRDPECDEWGRLFCRTKLAELAADEIERLQAERDELLAALKVAADWLRVLDNNRSAVLQMDRTAMDKLIAKVEARK